jgi:hypothetical protein
MGFTVAEMYPKSFISTAQALKKEGLSDRQKKKIEDVLIEYVPGKDKAVKCDIEKQTAEQMFASVPTTNQTTIEHLDSLSFN